MEAPSPIFPEAKTNTPSFHFEAGEHVTDSNEFAEDFRKLRQGHLDTHVWHGEGMSKRIASYAYNAPALLLGIDSLQPAMFNVNQEADWWGDFRKQAWYALPGRPNALNQSGEVLMARFDILGNRMMEPSMGGTVPQPLLRQENMYSYTAANENLISIGSEETAIAAFGVVLWRLIRHGVERARQPGASRSENDNPLSRKRGMSRREFLKKSIQATAAGAVGAWLLDQGRVELGKQLSFTSDEPTEEFLLGVNNLVKPRPLSSRWLDGRTGRGIRAIQPLAMHLGLPQKTQSSVLLGYTHAARAQEFIDDETKADEAIAVFGEELLLTAKTIYAGYYSIPLRSVPSQFTTNFLDYFTTIDVLRIKDPGGPAVQPSFPTLLFDHVSVTATLRSPQLENAIKHLRPNTKALISVLPLASQNAETTTRQPTP